MAHTIDNIEITKMGMGYNLNYSVDGKDYTVTGEFYIDKDGYLHHTHIADDEELDIVAKVDNKVNDIYDLAEYINNEESYPIDVEEIAEAHGWTLPTEDDDDYLVCVDEKGRKLVLVQNRKNPFKLIAEVQ
jgi:hypothetical protein